MNFTYKLIELVKKKHGLNSDYAVSKLTGLSTVKISEWKREKSEANAPSTIILMAAADISAKDALSIMTEHPATARGVLSNNSRMMYIMLNNKIKRQLQLRFMHQQRLSFRTVH